MSESTTELAVHLVAAAQGADAARLCDSKAFMDRVTALNPDTPGFVDRVAAAVQEAAQSHQAYRLSAEQPAEPAGQNDDAEPPAVPLGRAERLAHQASRREALTADRPAERITVEDVRDAGPGVVNAWATSGKLTKFGVAAKQQRRR